MQEKYIFTDGDIVSRGLGLDGKDGIVIHNKETNVNGYVHNKRAKDDDSYYAPYLVYKIGTSLQVDVPETELRDVFINNGRVNSSFTNSSIIWDFDRFGAGKDYIIKSGYDFVSPYVAQEIYLIGNPLIAAERQETMPRRTIQQMVDDYVNSIIYYFTTKGSQFSETELSNIKQKLIDRLLFELRFGLQGVTEVKLRNNRPVQLDKYYSTSNKIFCLDKGEQYTSALLSMSDEQFENLLEERDQREKFDLVSGQGKIGPTSKEIIKFIYEHYPEQAQDFYSRLSKFTVNDLAQILDECTYMSVSHKKMVLREVAVRGQMFEQINQQHIKMPDVDR